MKPRSMGVRNWVRFAGATVVAVAVGVAGISASAQTKSTSADAQKAGAEIMLMQPSATAAKSGENQFEVMVKGADGKPVNDADVSVVLVMPKSATMAEMRNEVKLKPAGNGTYRGAGNVMMAGKWATTVMVMKNGKESAQKKVSLTAK